MFRRHEGGMTVPEIVVFVPDNPALAAELPGMQVLPLAALADHPGEAIVFMELLLESGSGLELCRQLRAAPSGPVMRLVMVLDDDDREMRRRALQAGADDYVVGPLTAEQVRERVSGATSDAVRRPALAHGTIRLDRTAFQVRANGRPVAISPNEFNVLAYLLENRDRVLTRSELIRAVRDAPGSIDERTVDVWIGRIRRSLRSAGASVPIRTVRQLGYVLDS